MLRDYQRKAIDDLYAWMENNDGNPCLVLPTGGGKSHIVAAICKEAVQQWPETRILMLTHVKELIEQNAEKMRQHWPNAPLGIYSASIGQKNLEEPITFAGVQSVRNRAKEIGHIDLILIDECHMVSHNDTGSYRKLIKELSEINPALRVIGLSATPYRLGHGYITDKPAIFDGLVDPIGLEFLIHHGYLADLRSKVTDLQLSTEGIGKRNGDYIESEMQEAFDTDENNERVVDEVISLAGDRKSWLFFCTGIGHAEHIAELLNERGIPATSISGQTPKAERAEIIRDFKEGRFRALTNCNVLTTGFDYPDIDLIAMLRPTMSPGLYVQMAGRGLRKKSHTDHCLVLDFAGVVKTHGPITAVRAIKKAGDGSGDAPVKVCENCNEIVHASVRVCPACGTPFPVEKGKTQHVLHDDDIMGKGDSEMNVSSWVWRKHVSKTSGIDMIKISYYGKELTAKPIMEYLCVLHEGYAGVRARQTMFLIASAAGKHSEVSASYTIDQVCAVMNMAAPPDSITYKMDGKYAKITRRHYENKQTS